jgi:hypothetical protein
MIWEDALRMVLSSTGDRRSLPIAARRAAERCGWEQVGSVPEMFRRLYYGELLHDEQREDLAALGRIAE